MAGVIREKYCLGADQREAAGEPENVAESIVFKLPGEYVTVILTARVANHFKEAWAVSRLHRRLVYSRQAVDEAEERKKVPAQQHIAHEYIDAVGGDVALVVGEVPTGDATAEHVKWTTRKGAPNTPSPLALGDEIYFISDGGIATCADQNAKAGETAVSHPAMRAPSVGAPSWRVIR